jgi:UDP-N-acetyl-D-glucosamine dehydrogenase
MTPEFLIEAPVRETAESTSESRHNTPVEEAAKVTAESLLKTPVKEAAKSSFEFLRDTPVKEAAKSSFEFLRDTPVKEAAKSSFEFLRGTPGNEAADTRLRLRDVPAEVADRRVELLRDDLDEDTVEARVEFLSDTPEAVHLQLRRDVPGEELAEARVEFLRDAPDEESTEGSVESLLDPPVREAPTSSPESPVEAPVEDPIADAFQPWEGQSPWETAAGGVRFTRETPTERALVAVIGLGQAGLPSAMALRDGGFRVLGIDTSSSRLEDIRSERTEVLGVGCEELRRRLNDPDFTLTGELEAVRSATSVVICVPAIVDAQRHPSLEALKRACAAVVEHAHAGQTLVLTSTSYVGCTRELLVEPLEQRGLHVGEDVFVAFSPERGDPGVAEHEQLHTPRVVGAVSETCFAHASQVLSHVCDGIHRVSSPEAAEMVKLYESSFRAVNIALAFEMADACRMQELDLGEVTAAAATKPFGFLAHYPSAGVGGPGAGVDPHYLLHPMRERGRPALLTEEAMRSVAARPRRVAMRAHELLQHSGERMRDARVLVVGAAYKPGVASCEGAPAVEIISWLTAEGVQVEYHDPLVPMLRIDGDDMYSIDPDPRRDASGFGPEDYDLVIVVTLQPGHDYGWLKRCPQVLDCTYSEPTGRRYLLP